MQALSAAPLAISVSQKSLRLEVQFITIAQMLILGRRECALLVGGLSVTHQPAERDRLVCCSAAFACAFTASANQRVADEMACQ